MRAAQAQFIFITAFLLLRIVTGNAGRWCFWFVKREKICYFLPSSKKPQISQQTIFDTQAWRGPLLSADVCSVGEQARSANCFYLSTDSSIGDLVTESVTQTF